MKTSKDAPPKTAVKSRRRYDAEFKRRLVRMSLEPGASTAKIALEHELNTNLLFNWRRRYLREISAAPGGAVELLPVKVTPNGDTGGTAARNRPRASPQRACSGTIDIDLRGGRIRVKGAVDVELLRSVVQMVRGR